MGGFNDKGHPETFSDTYRKSDTTSFVLKISLFYIIFNYFGEDIEIPPVFAIFDLE